MSTNAIQRLTQTFAGETLRAMATTDIQFAGNAKGRSRSFADARVIPSFGRGVNVVPTFTATHRVVPAAGSHKSTQSTSYQTTWCIKPNTT